MKRSNSSPSIKDVHGWCQALRSGKYKQGKGQLHSIHGHCCIGVACDVFIKKKDLVLDSLGEFIYGGIASNQFKAPKWLKDINIEFNRKADISLVALNDGYYDNGTHINYSFDEIADLLELVYVHKALD